MPNRLVHEYRALRVRLPQPWSRRLGQALYSPRIVTGHASTRQAFAEEPLIERLALSEEELQGLGAGFSERVIEIPWVVRELRALEPARVLDAGTAFAPMIYKWLLVRQAATVETVDLAEADVAGLVNHVADIRELPFEDGSFDVATCISTLEHIGMDNTQYSIRSGGGGDVQALRELGRVAARVLVTVPGGCDADLPHQRQYSPARFEAAAKEAGLAVEQLDIFEHRAASGWTRSDATRVTSRMYGQDAPAAAVVLCARLRGRAA
jgi:hypothetical protein